MRRFFLFIIYDDTHSFEKVRLGSSMLTCKEKPDVLRLDATELGPPCHPLTVSVAVILIVRPANPFPPVRPPLSWAWASEISSLAPRIRSIPVALLHEGAGQSEASEGRFSPTNKRAISAGS